MSLIKMFPQGCLHSATNKKNVIADVIKRCVMIHDNNYAVGKKTTHDLINVRGARGKSIPDFITDKSGRTRELSQIPIRKQLLDLQADNLCTCAQPVWCCDFLSEGTKEGAR